MSDLSREEFKEFKEFCKFMFDGHEFVPNPFGGGGQRHTHGLVGNLWRVKNPDSVRIGDCFLAGRLKKGDLFLCVEHSGDCFQTYIYVKEYDNCLVSKSKWSFGSYGIGDSELVELAEGAFETLKGGGRVEWGERDERV